MNNTVSKIITVLFLSIVALKVIAVDYYPNGTGLFNDVNTWAGGATYPSSAADDITFTWFPLPPVSNTISLNNDYTIGNFDFSSCSAMAVTLNSANTTNYTLTVADLMVEPDFTLILDNVTLIVTGATTVTGGLIELRNNASLIFNTASLSNSYTLRITDNSSVTVNGTTNTNGGAIDVQAGTNIQFNSNVTMAGAGVSLDIASLATVDIIGTLTFTGGINNIEVYGTLSMDNMVASGGSQDLNIYSGGEVIVRNDASFSGSATFEIENNGEFSILDDMTVSGGADGTIDGTLDVTGTLNIIDYIALDGSGYVTAGDYNGTGSIFGSSMGTLVDGQTYTDGGGTAVPVAPLPIKLISFSATTHMNVVVLDWQTASETNNHYFTLERSSDGIFYEFITQIEGSGTTNQFHSYSFTDRTPLNGNSYYRLSQTDYNGESEKLAPASVFFTSGFNLQIYPNPVVDYLNIEGWTADEGVQTLITLYSISGSLLYESSETGTINPIAVSDFPMGTYILNLTLNGFTQTRVWFKK